MDKDATLRQVEDGFARLLAAVDGLDEAAMSERFYDDWCAKDILAHIAGWHHPMTDAMQRMARGERPTPEGVDYSDADAWNARFTAAMKPQSASTIVADLRQSYMNYLRAARAIPDDRYGEGKTVDRLLEASGHGHYREHLPPLEEFRKRRAAAG
jgi:hypothetical protein